MLHQASPDHLSQLAEVKSGLGEAEISARFAWIAQQDVTWHVWWVAQEPCGWALIQWQGKPTAPHYPDIFDLYVHPQWRGQGIGSQILQACEQIVRQRGFSCVGLAVNPDENPRALALYQRLGYMPTGHEKYVDGVYNGMEDWVIDLVKQL